MAPSRSHPKYTHMVTRAFSAISAKDYSNVHAITRYIRSHYNVGNNRNIIRLHVALALKRLTRVKNLKNKPKKSYPSTKGKVSMQRRRILASKKAAGSRKTFRHTSLGVKRATAKATSSKRMRLRSAGLRPAIVPQPKIVRRRRRSSPKRNATNLISKRRNYRRSNRRGTKKNVRRHTKRHGGILMSNIVRKSRRHAAVAARRHIRRISKQ